LTTRRGGRGLPRGSSLAKVVWNLIPKFLPHFGETNGVVGCHLGIDIPGAWPDCGMEVNKEAKICEEGKSSSLRMPMCIAQLIGVITKELY